MKKTYRIVHLTTVHHPYDPRIYYKQCVSLLKANYETILIAQPAPENVTENKEINHIPLKKYRNRWKRMMFGTWEIYRKAKKLKADIYVFHDPELMLVGRLLKNKYNIVIYDIHEDYVTSILQKDYLSKWMATIVSKVYTFVESILTRKMELSLAEKYYQDMYPSGKLLLNYPLMNEKFIDNHRGDKPLVKRVLYTGNVTEDRGALIHARIPLINPEVSVQFVGKCDRSLAEKMYNVAGVQKDLVHIEGIDTFIVKEQMEDYYLKENWLAGLALFPPTEHYMKKELTKFFEYMNVGLPIICSNFPMWEKFINQYECGITVDPHDDEQIAKAIQILLDNPELAKQMGENGKRAIMNELNWQKEEEKLLHWYNELLQSVQK